MVEQNTQDLKPSLAGTPAIRTGVSYVCSNSVASGREDHTETDPLDLPIFLVIL